MRDKTHKSGVIIYAVSTETGAYVYVRHAYVRNHSTLKEYNPRGWQKWKENYKGSCQLWLVRYNRRSNKSTRCRICSSQRYENGDTTHRKVLVLGWFKQSYTKLHELHYITLLTAVQASRFFFSSDIKFSLSSTMSSASVRSRQTLALIVSKWIHSFTVANMAISQRQNNLCTLATLSYVLPQVICVLFGHRTVSVKTKISQDLKQIQVSSRTLWETQLIRYCQVLFPC